MTFLDPEKVSYALPAASPDGQTIAYDRQGEGWLFSWMGTSEAVDLTGFGLRENENDRAASPAWSPDGARLAWVVGGGFAPDGDWRLAVVVLDLTAETSVILHPYEPVGVGGWPDAPVWSPDGEWLAYEVWPAAEEEIGGIWVLRADGSEEIRLGPGSGPVWSPDGQRLVYTEHVSAEKTTVWFVDTADWQPQPLDLAPDAVVVAWW